MIEEERRIAAALAAGDARAALPLLIHRYGEEVYRRCRRLLGTDADADDVSQTVFLQAFEAIQRGCQVENPGAWLRGIARHRCLDKLVGRRRDPLLIEEEELERVPDADSLDPFAIDPGMSQALDECLDRLDPRSRVAVLLRFNDQLSYEAIGQLTGDRPGALRVRVSRALIALRECMEKKGGTP